MKIHILYAIKLQKGELEIEEHWHTHSFWYNFAI